MYAAFGWLKNTSRVDTCCGELGLERLKESVHRIGGQIRDTVANKQLEIMGRYMAELGLSPSARAWLRLPAGANGQDPVTRIEFVTVYTDKDGNEVKRRMDMDGRRDDPDPEPKVITYELDGRV